MAFRISINFIDISTFFEVDKWFSASVSILLIKYFFEVDK